MSVELFDILRHGRTQGNEDNRYRGHSNEPFAQLAPEGKVDVMEAALYLKKLPQPWPDLRPRKYSLLLSDDCIRSKESAEIASAILDIPEIEYDKRLRPLDTGKFTGKNKFEYPLDEYIKDRNKKIPGGESMANFDRRLAAAFGDILELIAQIKEPVLVIGHGSTISFLYNATNKGEKKVGYEGLVHPGGVVIFTNDGIKPMFKLKSEAGEKIPGSKKPKE
jgi:broad specificity phosphatase PhoE